MKGGRLLYFAFGVLVTTNTLVLLHVARNRAGAPDAELELTERELRYMPHGSDDSSLTLTLQWQNPAPEYSYQPTAAARPDFLDLAKLEALGFDVSVPADSTQADRFYRGQRSREVFVALELDGPAWREWLTAREAVIGDESQYAPEISKADRLRIERDTASRLVAVDVDRDPARLRQKFADRTKVLILPTRARAVLDDGRSRSAPRRLRGSITSLAIENISVPHAFRSQLVARAYYLGWQMAGDGTVTTAPPAFAATIRAGVYHEPWVTAVRRLQ